LKNDVAHSLPGDKAMRQCNYCGSELRDQARFCGRCGKRVENETETTTNIDDPPIVDIPVPPLTATATFSEPHDSTSENDVDDEEMEALPQRKLEANREEEEQQPRLTFESEDDEELLPLLAFEDDVEERTENPGSSSSTPGDLNAEEELPVDGAQSKGTAGDHEGPTLPALPPSPLREGSLAGKTESVSAPGAKTRSSSVPKTLLILLAIFIIAAGCVAALVGLLRGRLPGTGEATNAQSSPSVSKIVNDSGQALNATVCASPSTTGSPGTSNGIGLTLSTPSGCSSFATATATSLCLIFPYNAGASHRYVLNVTNVTIDSKAYHLVLGIAAYTGSASYSDVEHVSVGIGDGSTGENFSWLYRSGSVRINSNEQTGTMDVILGSVGGGNTVHVVGSWTCGRLIKNS
jgi:hypothetical protein